MEAKRDVQCLNATEVSIYAPDEDPLNQQSADLDEDDPSVNPKIQAATRDTEPTVQLILVYRLDECDFLDPKGTEPFCEDDVPDVKRIRRLLDNEVTISHKGCFSHYVKQPVPAGWKKCGMLRHHRVVRLDAKGQALEGEFDLSCGDELGVQWRNKEC